MLDEINREVIRLVVNKRRNKIMKKYKDNKENKFFNFIITVPRQEDKDELLEAFRYLHDLKELDTDFIIVNQLVHLYMDEPENPVKIVVDRGAFAYLNKEHKNENN
jgi:hypothetical protein